MAQILRQIRGRRSCQWQRLGRPEFVPDFDSSGETISPIGQQDQSPADACIAAASGALCARRPKKIKLRLDAASRVHILNHMVYYKSTALDRTFAALADPTRRALLARLSERTACR